VTFNTEQQIVDSDGSITMATSADAKTTAMSHTPHTPPLADALRATNPLADAGAAAAANDDGLDPSLLVKKKKKKPKVTEEDEDANEEGGEAAAAADDGDDQGLDLSIKKKKKKKPKAEDDEFVAKVKALEVDDKTKDEGDGDMKLGTGIWSHDASALIPYPPLLQRLFDELLEKDPEHAMGGQRNYKIIPPQCMREGNKKTIFANIAEMCTRMRRTDEHVTAYLFAELGTTGSVDGSRRLVIKGRFQQKQIENVIRKYISTSPGTASAPDAANRTQLNMSRARRASPSRRT
jgi:translation initiation factor 2 subunit 2